MKQITLLAIMLLNVNMALAATPWLQAPQSISGAISQVSQSEKEFWKGRDEETLPAELSLDTTWLNVDYGVSDNFSADVRLGYAKSDYDPVGSESGLTDSVIGINWRIQDEFINDGMPSLALRFAATIAGNYDTDKINSIGDGASGLESSLLVGKIFSANIALSGEGGYRYRNKDVPNELFANLAAYFQIVHGLRLSAAYHAIESLGEVDITDADFSGDFSTLAESKHIANLGLSYQFLGKYNAAANYAKVLRGRNTSKNDIIGLTLSAAF